MLRAFGFASFVQDTSITSENSFLDKFSKGSKEVRVSQERYFRAVSTLVASIPHQNISDILSIIKAGTEEISNDKNSIFKSATFGSPLDCLVTRLSSDEDNTSLILSILTDLCFSSDIAHNAVTQYGLLEHVGKILKLRREDEIINNCLRLVANVCLYGKQQVSNYLVRGESNLNIIKSIVRVQCLVLEEDVPSKTILMLSLSSLHNILRNTDSPEWIVENCGIVKTLGYTMVKFIDDWKTSEENRDILTSILQLLEFCSKINCDKILFELKNTGIGDAILLLSDLIMMPTFSLTVTNIVSNLQRHYSDASFSDIYGKLIEKLRDSNETEDQQYSFFLKSLCQLSTADILTENFIGTLALSLLNVLQSHVELTEASLEHCQMVIATLRQDHFKCCLRLMLDSGILTILSSKLDWIFGVENQSDLHHQSQLMPLPKYVIYQYTESNAEDYGYYLSRYHDKMFESQFYGNLDTWHAEYNAMRARSARDYIRNVSPAASALQSKDDQLVCILLYNDLQEDKLSAVTNEPKRTDSKKNVGNTLLYSKLASEIVNFIKCVVDMEPTALELGTSDIVYKLLLFFLPENMSFKPQRIKKLIENIIKKPEHLVNLLTQTQFVCTANKLFIPIHNSSCVRCIDLFTVGYMIMEELTKVVEDTIDKGDIAHSLYTASPTIKQTLVVALPFFSEKKSTLHKLMIKWGGLDVLIDAFQQEFPQRGFISGSLNVLAHKIHIKDPTNFANNLDFDDTNDQVATVLNLKNYRPVVGNLVTFKLDNDSCLKADRELLASKSDFFNQLLFGQFKESNEEVVRLSETPYLSLKLVLMLLQLDDIASGDKLCRNRGKFLDRIGLTVVLDAIVLCDRFLLKDLYTSLMRFVLHCEFSLPSIVYIYRWLLDWPTDILRTEIISYCLVGCMSKVQRNCLFDELLHKPKYKEQFLDDVRNMFRKYLSASCD